MSTESAGLAFEITHSNTENFPNDIVTRGIYVGVGGDIKVLTHGGKTVTFGNTVAGTILPVRVVRVFATGTGASELVGLY